MRSSSRLDPASCRRIDDHTQTWQMPQVHHSSHHGADRDVCPDTLGADAATVLQKLGIAHASEQALRGPQFQGGIDAGEDPRAAAMRELTEETGIHSAHILAEHSAWLQYDFPPGKSCSAVGSLRITAYKWLPIFLCMHQRAHWQGALHNNDMILLTGGDYACDSDTIAEVLAIWKEEGRRNHRGQRQKW